MKDKISTIHRMQSFLIENAKQVYQCYHLEFFDVFIHPTHSFSYLNYAIPTKPIGNKFEEEYSKELKRYLVKIIDKYDLSFWKRFRLNCLHNYQL